MKIDAVVEEGDTSNSDNDLGYETSSTISGLIIHLHLSIHHLSYLFLVDEDEEEEDDQEETKTIFENTNTSFSSIKTASEDNSLSLHNNSRDTDPQDDDSNNNNFQRSSISSTKPPLIPRSKKNERASILSTASSPPPKASQSLSQSQSQPTSSSPFNAGRLSIIQPVENTALPTPSPARGNGYNDFSNDQDDDGHFDDYGGGGEEEDLFDTQEDNQQTGGRRSSYNYHQPSPAKKTVSSPKNKVSPSSKKDTKKNTKKAVTLQRPVRKTLLSQSDDEKEVEEDEEKAEDDEGEDGEDEVKEYETPDKSRRISFASTVFDTPKTGEFGGGIKVKDDESYSGSGDENDEGVYSLSICLFLFFLLCNERINKLGDATDHDTSFSSTSKSYVDTSFLRASRKQIYDSDGEEGLGSEEDYETFRVNENGVRRSSRQTKGRRLEFWKNERPVYTQV